MMTTWSRLFAPAILAMCVLFGANTTASAQTQNDLVRVVVDIADVIFRGTTPYYRQGDYSADDQLTMQRDRNGRAVFYRSVPRGQYYGTNDTADRLECNKNGKCEVRYYDPRHDRNGQDSIGNDHRGRFDRNGRYWDGRQWRYRDYRAHNRNDDDDHDEDDHDEDDYDENDHEEDDHHDDDDD